MSIVSSRRPPRKLSVSSNGHPYQEEQPSGAHSPFLSPRPDWSNWRQYLIDQSQSATKGSGGVQKLPHLLWGLAQGEVSADQWELFDALTRAEKSKASTRLLASTWSQRETIGRFAESGDALTLLAWARAMPRLANVADADDWWTAIDRLVSVCQDERAAQPDALWPQQLVGVELPLTLGRCLPDARPYAQILQRGWEALEKSLLDVIDDDGFVLDAPSEHWLPLMACWTRCLELGHEGGQSLHDDAQSRYQDLVESLLRLVRRDGSLRFTNPSLPISKRDSWRAAARFVDNRLKKALHAVWGEDVLQLRSNRAQAKPSDLPPPSANSERAGLAVLRPHWRTPCLAIDYRAKELKIELAHGGETYLAGPCNPQVTMNGRLLEPQSPWEGICWITDDDVDYLELQLSLSEGVEIQRHFVFARADEFVFVADAVLGEKAANLEYKMSLPLAGNVSIEPAGETRELALIRGGRRRATVLPLALAEWRNDHRFGELAVKDQVLELTQSAAQSQNLFAPWFIDLAPRRLRREMTWRQLTVVEDRQIQPPDAAVGYRVRVGSGQWLFYRSLDACGNRTVLGHNLVSEFLAARFSRRGVPETLIEIEASADDDE